MKKYITTIAALLLLAACQQADEPGTAPGGQPITATVATPPSFTADEPGTRATIDANLTTQWEDGDQMTITLTYHHRSGLTDTKTETITRASSKWDFSALPAWPVANITHADLTALITGKAGGPRFRGTALGVKPGEPFNITFGTDAHLTTAVRFTGLTGSEAVTVGAASGTGNTTLYVEPGTATALTGTAAGTPFTIDLGTGSPLGKLYSVIPGDAPGETGPGDTAEKARIKAATDAFVAWAQAYIAETEKTDYTLTYHVDLALSDKLTDGLWTPIGTYISDTDFSKAFTHIFDGAGYTISGLKIENTDANAAGQGLFGVTNGATIANVTIVEPEVTSTAKTTGALVGRAVNTTISHCHVTGGTITGGDNQAGGLAGFIISGTHVVGCSANATVTSTSHTGGLIGSISSTGTQIVAACYSTGTTIRGGINVGGLVGFNSGTIRFCYSTANATGTGTRVGGLVGNSENTGKISSCYATGDVEGPVDNSRYTGSLVGRISDSNEYVSYCCATGTANNGDNRLIGTNDDTKDDTNKQYNFDTQKNDILTTLKNNAVTSITDVRIYDATEPLGYKIVTITKDIWQDDLTLDLAAGIQ